MQERQSRDRENKEIVTERKIETVTERRPLLLQDTGAECVT